MNGVMFEITWKRSWNITPKLFDKVEEMRQKWDVDQIYSAKQAFLWNNKDIISNHFEIVNCLGVLAHLWNALCFSLVIKHCWHHNTTRIQPPITQQNMTDWGKHWKNYDI